MGKLAVQKYFSFMMLIITLMMMIFTIVGLFGGETNPSPHIRYTILKTDSHGNWTKAKTRVTESGKTYTCTIERVISYYE